MSYDADKNYPVVDRVFGTSIYTVEALRFINDHLGENPTAAMTHLTPEAVNVHRHNFRDVWGGKNNRDLVESAEDQFQAAYASEARCIENALRRFYELEDMQDSGILQWAGYDAVRQTIATWEERQRRFQQKKQSNAGRIGRHPEMYMFDSRNNPHYQAPGSNAGRVRDYDLELLQLQQLSTEDFTKDLRTKQTPYDEHVPENLREGDDWVGCPVCSYQQQYEPPDSHEAHVRARMAVLTHMRMIQKNRDEHQQALIKVQANN